MPKIITPLLSLLLFSVSGFASHSKKVQKHIPHITAKALMRPTAGNKVHGTVQINQIRPGVVQMHIHLYGLQKNSIHAFHVHENGDCSAADASSAGAHFNPTNQPHGGPGDIAKHAGDLGNLTANSKGEVHIVRTYTGLDLVPGKTTSVIGLSLIVHDKPDDLKSQPAGNAGPRAACGVISRIEPSGHTI